MKKTQITTGYIPKDWSFIYDNEGQRVYTDHHVQVTYVNLKTFSRIIQKTEDNAKDDLFDAINNLKASAIKNQTADLLGFFAAEILEGAAAFFPEADAAAGIAEFFGKLISGIATNEVANSVPGDDIQSKANEIRDGMIAIFNATKRKIDEMVVDPEKYWTDIFHCEDYSNLGIKGDVTLSDMAECLDYFPQEEDPMHDDFQNYLSHRCKSILVSKLISVKWQVKKYPVYWCKDYYYWRLERDGRNFDFDYEQYNPSTDDYFWCQDFEGGHDDGLPHSYQIETEKNQNTSKDFLHFILEAAIAMSDRFSSVWGYLESNEVVDGDKTYVGNHINYMILTDNDGNPAPEILSDWLFMDDCYNTVVNEVAVATREEVYTKWGL